MKQIRRNVFETNSSSTHSLAIPRETSTRPRDNISFSLETFGWEFDEVDPADYLYTAIFEHPRNYTNKHLFYKNVRKLSKILESVGITRYEMELPKYSSDTMNYEDYEKLAADSHFKKTEKKLWDGYCIDHSEEVGCIVDAILADEEMCLRFLAEGRAFTGNDNCREDEYGKNHRDRKTIARAVANPDKSDDYEYVTEDNPYYIPDHDFMFKGN